MSVVSKTVSVVVTVKNDPAGCALMLKSLACQTRQPEEIIIVDGGSTDGTPGVASELVTANPRVRVIEAPGTNIAEGRNIGIRSALGEIIATTDGGCRAEPDWLENLTRPFESDPEIEFAAGFYRIDGRTLLENVVGLATMRGQLDPVDPVSFNPSARSMAYTKAAWLRAGGFPEWIRYSEDTLFDQKMRRLNVGWRFVGDAIVHWRPRTSLCSIARQFYNYGTGRGHTQIGAADFAYNIRNLGIVLATACLCFVTPWAMVALAGQLGYFYLWTFHGKALRVARLTGRLSAYPLCLLVMWIILASNLVGYLVGSLQRWRHRERYVRRMEAYLSVS